MRICSSWRRGLSPESLSWMGRVEGSVNSILRWSVFVCNGFFFRPWEGDLGGLCQICWWAFVRVPVRLWGFGFAPCRGVCEPSLFLWTTHPTGLHESHCHHRGFPCLNENGTSGWLNLVWFWFGFVWPCRMLRILSLLRIVDCDSCLRRGYPSLCWRQQPYYYCKMVPRGCVTWKVTFNLSWTRRGSMWPAPGTRVPGSPALERVLAVIASTFLS